MSALVKLWYFKQRATIRNLFHKPASAVFTTLMILLYGFIFISIFQIGSLDAKDHINEIQKIILLGIGMCAIIIFSMMLQKRKALFMVEDSFYLFSGPFSRAQIMRYLMGQTALQSLLFSFLPLFITVSMGSMFKFPLQYIVVSIMGTTLVFTFFLILVDYLYILSITNKKYLNYTKIIVTFIIVFVVGLFGYSLAQNNFAITNGLMDFAENEMFYALPLFGWLKLLLVSCIEENYLMSVLAFALIAVANGIVYFFFVNFKGDFYEQAMMDSQEVSDYVKQVKSGKQNAMNLNAKVKTAKIKFLPGAGAVFSKNLLIMLKTRDFIRMQEIIIIVVYFAVSVFTDLGFGMFMYMLIIWIFQLLQTSDLVRELKNYQIYLIPAKPFAKLIFVILPTLMKITIVLSVAIIGSGLYYGMGLAVIVQYVLTLLGYTCIFVSGTVLSIRLLKSRTNIMMESMLRMLLIVGCSIPSILLILYFVFQEGRYDNSVMEMISVLTLSMNFILSFIILYCCKGMLNGREISSD